MKTVWTSGLESQDKKDVTANFKEAIVLRKRLVEMLEKKIISSRNACVSKDLYSETANWPLLQADGIGYERALKEIISLIEK